MIEAKKAVCYLCNGIQFVRLTEHEWTDTHGLQTDTVLGGTSNGQDALGGMTIEALADFFSSTMEEAQNFEVLDISDARALQAHTQGLTMARTNATQMAINNSPANNSAMECEFNPNVSTTV